MPLSEERAGVAVSCVAFARCPGTCTHLAQCSAKSDFDLGSLMKLTPHDSQLGFCVHLLEMFGINYMWLMHRMFQNRAYCSRHACRLSSSRARGPVEFTSLQTKGIKKGVPQRKFLQKSRMRCVHAYLQEGGSQELVIGKADFFVAY